jgi:hypothetical protein
LSSLIINLKRLLRYYSLSKYLIRFWKIERQFFLNYLFIFKSAIEEKEKVPLTQRNLLSHSQSLQLKDVSFDSTTLTSRSFLKSAYSRATNITINNKKWLPDLEILPHVIR